MPHPIARTALRWTVPLAAALLLVAALASVAETQPRSLEAPGGRIERYRLPAPSLAGNLLEDPAEKDVLVYLPPGYDLESERSFPSIYLLHGIFDHPQGWIDFFRLPEILDEGIAAGTLPAVVVVMPHGGIRLGGGYYRNSPVAGNWADFVTRDLVAFVDAAYRTLPRAAARAVVGHSMGGYGALHLSMEHPGTFAVAYAMSPCCLAPEEDLGQGNPVWTRLPGVTWEQVETALAGGDFYLVAALGLLTATAPDPTSPPFYGAVPFARVRGETVPREPVYSEWLLRFPVHQVLTHREALLSLRALGIDYGVGDQFAHIPEGARRLSARLAELRIPHRFDVYAGDHRQQVRARLAETVLPFVGRHLETGAE